MLSTALDMINQSMLSALKEKEETGTLESTQDIIQRKQVENCKDPAYRKKYGHLFDLSRIDEMSDPENYPGNMICYPEQPPSIQDDIQVMLSGAPLRGIVEHNPEFNAKLKECETNHVIHFMRPSGERYFGEFQNDLMTFVNAGCIPNKAFGNHSLFDLRDRLVKGEESFLFVPLEVSSISPCELLKIFYRH